MPYREYLSISFDMAKFLGWLARSSKTAKSLMTKITNIRIAPGADEALKGFVEAWRRADYCRGDERSVLVFDHWETLRGALAGARYGLLRHLHTAPAKSVEELAAKLGRPVEDVQVDVDVLENAGLLVRTEDWIQPQADRFVLEISATSREASTKPRSN
jgi:predicted transcriptional regulator